MSTMIPSVLTEMSGEATSTEVLITRDEVGREILDMDSNMSIDSSNRDTSSFTDSSILKIGVFNGFEPTEDDENEYELDETKFDKNSYEIENYELDYDEYDTLDDEIQPDNFTRNSPEKLKNETECSCCVCSAFVESGNEVKTSWYLVTITVDLRYVVIILVVIVFVVSFFFLLRSLWYNRRQLRLIRKLKRTDVRYHSRTHSLLKVPNRDLLFEATQRFVPPPNHQNQRYKLDDNPTSSSSDFSSVAYSRANGSIVEPPVNSENDDDDN